MADKFEIRSKVEGGKLQRNRKLLTQVIQSFEGKEILLVVSKAKKQRSNQQNRYLWGCVYPILQHAFLDIGYRLSIDEVHGFIKDHFMSLGQSEIIEEIVVPESGQVLKRIKSTTELTTTQFAEYVMEIQEWASVTLGVEIPDPNQQITMGIDG